MPPRRPTRPVEEENPDSPSTDDDFDDEDEEDDDDFLALPDIPSPGTASSDALHAVRFCRD